ncbi:MAG: L-threonylcarbamoyladenylate synthase [Verrucomicrobiota bacterium JB022]|nr:L-threonylcarbamoyladenylate synthase [Verrucomicrobiota bacterium JB022]
MQRFEGNNASLEFLAGRLKAGEVVALPTETVYGLAANALNPTACRQIFEIKGRPLIDPLIVHVGSQNAARRLAEWPEKALLLAEHFWPGPLTLVLPKKKLVPDLVTAGRDTVALRQPAHPLALRLLTGYDLQLAAPSANPFGYVSPTTLDHVEASLGERVAWGLEGGPCQVGVESTIVAVTKAGEVGLLRPGGVSVEALEQVLGQPVNDLRRAAPDHVKEGLAAPGMLARHYSPSTPLALFAGGETPAVGEGEAIVWQKRPASGPAIDGQTFWLSEDGNPAVVARELFGMLRRLDERGFPRVWFELAEDSGLGLAINDRLGRAAAKR